MALTIKLTSGTGKSIQLEIPAGWQVVYSGQTHFGDKYYKPDEQKFIDVPSPNLGMAVGKFPLIIRKPFPNK